MPYPDPNNAAAVAAFVIPASKQSLVTSILSAGTFFGAIIAGDIADFIGRRFTIIMGCAIFTVGCILETASAGLGLMVAGRLICGFGVGFISAIVILYMSEICPRKVRGALVASYQFCITIGILLANCVVYATENRLDTGSYRIVSSNPPNLRLLIASNYFSANRHPIPLGNHSRRRSCNPPRLASILCQKRAIGESSISSLQSSRTTNRLNIHPRRTRRNRSQSRV